MRLAFDDTISAINNYDDTFYLMEAFLLREFAKQNKAVREFRSHLGIIDRYRFNRAWEKYKGADDNTPDFRHYIMSADVQDTILSHINGVLKFSK